MYRFSITAIVVAAVAVASARFAGVSAGAQGDIAFGGIWSINRSLTEAPREIGFSADWMAAGAREGGQTVTGGGGRGGRGASGGGSRSAPGGFVTSRETYEDAKRIQLLTAEVRTPPARLTIVDAPDAVTFTNELGQSRTFHPSGRDEEIEIEGVSTRVTTRRDGGRLIVEYHVGAGRDLRYTYSRVASPPQIVMEVRFVEHNAGDTVRLVYEPGDAVTTAPAAATLSPLSKSSGAAAPVPAAPSPADLDARPGAELRGLKILGILVEDLSAQATACGLDHDAIQAALSKRLTDAGFAVRANSDEDTYLYVNAATTSVAAGTCVTRYDAFLYTHTTATLSYQQRPVLVQVSLIHRGSIGASTPSGHGAAVARGLEGIVDSFITQIRDANK